MSYEVSHKTSQNTNLLRLKFSVIIKHLCSVKNSTLYSECYHAALIMDILNKYTYCLLFTQTQFHKLVSQYFIDVSST